ncbi:MAG: hypothetical protein KDB07_06580, partial [Planctomycetes bacterium]|nr:hypothetical protein [Planctomycetota bacterium]
DIYGGASNLMLFNSGSAYALQEDIAGVRVAQGTALPRKVPEGGDFGSFYYVNPQGRVTAILPMTITHLENNGGEQFLAFVDLWGQPGRLTMAPNLRTPVDMGEKGFAIPDDMLFMPLKHDTRLVPDVMLFSKTASPDNVELFYNGAYNFRGAPVDKVAAEHKHHLDEADAEFMAVSLGLSTDEARDKMAAAYVEGSTTFLGRQLVTKQERQEKIAAITQQIAYQTGDISHLRRDTVKLASMLPDMATPQSVDAVLSLNFINQENLMLFIESLPHLEVARRDLAELYLSTMVGLPDVSSAAILRAMENLAEVVKGLRKVRMRAMLV